jgi:hypothetical protein
MQFVSRLALLASALGLAGLGSSCNLNPVHRAGVTNLGPERDDLYPVESEYHRPGEPCALCHSKDGPADSQFVLAGTIFWWDDTSEKETRENRSYLDRVDQAYVRVLDANKTRKCFVTNCNGNFFVRPEDFPRITFPLLVSVERTRDPGRDDANTIAFRRMTGHIGREASCAVCHIQGIRDFASPDHIRLFDTEQQFRDQKIRMPACPPGPDDPPPVTVCPEDQ